MAIVYEEISNKTKNGKQTYYISHDIENLNSHGDIGFMEVDNLGGNQTQRNSENRFFQRIKLFILEAFFPEGYPESVSNDYLTYQAWDTLQAFASSISGSLATKAVLEGVGVGDETATSLAATITWLLRQGAGMIGQILFTWMQGSDLDHNCKKWRLFADILNDSAMCLELSGPLWPSFITQFILCFASVARSLVGVAGGATRTAITQHQAKAGNISDVAAKDGSQETLVNLVALLVNLMILPLIADNLALTWILFFCLTVLHLFANFKAVSSLCFETLNKDRLLLVLQTYLNTNKRAVGNPKEINEKENVFIGLGLSENDLFQHIPEYRDTRIKINIGVSFNQIVSRKGSYKTMNSKLIQNVRQNMSEFNFSVVPHVSSHKSHDYNILLSAKFRKEQLLHAYFIAFRKAYSSISQSVSDSGKMYDEEFCTFKEKLVQAGWKIEQLQLNTEGFTGNFL